MANSSVVAVDVGGTSIKAAVVDRQGATVLQRVLSTDADSGADAVVDRICDVVASLAAQAPGVCAAGVAVPGIVDEQSGIAAYSANIGWRNLPLRSLVAARLGAGMPVALAHDVRAGAVTEATAGVGRDTRDFVFVTVGTGIAGAVVLDRVPYTGAHGAAGELGHVTVRRDGEACRCGGRGCLEAYASAAAIMRRYEAAGGGHARDAAQVIDAAEAGDAVAARTWADALDSLALALAGYVVVLDPERIVIGGGMAEAGDRMLVPLSRHLDHLLSVTEAPPLQRAAAGTRAGYLGAAILAFEAAGTDRSALGWSYGEHVR